MLLLKGNDLVSEGRTENSTNHSDTFTKTFGWEMSLSKEDKRGLGANTRAVNRVQRTAKNFSELCHGCGAPAAMRQLSIRSSRPSSLPRDSHTNKSAGVFCFAKRLVKRAPRRNRRDNGAGKKVNDRIDFIVFREGKILCPLPGRY